MVKKNVGKFYELQKQITKNQIKQSLELEKNIKRKGYKLYVKWKSYDDLFNSWINKKDIV